MYRGGLVIALITALAAPARAAEIELKNDGWSDGQPVNVQAGFKPGDIGAARFTPPTGGPFPVTKIQFLFAGGTSTETVTVRVWADTGSTSPGSQLYTNDYAVTGADDALQEIDLTGEGILVSGPFRVGFLFTHSAPPSLTTDLDGISAPDNFIFDVNTGLWFAASSTGVTGDFVLRAFVDDGAAPPVPDAGVPGPDANGPGGPDSGAGDCTSNGDCAVGEYCNEFGACSFDCREDNDCGTDMACNSLGMCVAAEGDGGGCGCRTGERGGGGAALLLLAVVLLAIRRRSGA